MDAHNQEVSSLAGLQARLTPARTAARYWLMHYATGRQCSACLSRVRLELLSGLWCDARVCCARHRLPQAGEMEAEFEDNANRTYAVVDAHVGRMLLELDTAGAKPPDLTYVLGRVNLPCTAQPCLGCEVLRPRPLTRGF